MIEIAKKALNLEEGRRINITGLCISCDNKECGFVKDMRSFIDRKEDIYDAEIAVYSCDDYYRKENVECKVEIKKREMSEKTLQKDLFGNICDDSRNNVYKMVKCGRCGKTVKASEAKTHLSFGKELTVCNDCLRISS